MKKSEVIRIVVSGRTPSTVTFVRRHTENTYRQQPASRESELIRIASSTNALGFQNQLVGWVWERYGR